MSQQEEVSVDELKEILERYCIGKKPLAALLGWGATTVLRYMEGVCPSGEYAGHLKKIYEEPLVYLELLEEHKERLTPIAYKKSKNAVLRYLSSSKLRCGVQYLIERSEADISPYRIVMTLFYAQAFSLALTDRALFQEECELSGEGEVPYADLYGQLKCRNTGGAFGTGSLFDAGEEHFINAAYEMLLWYGPAEIKTVFSSERRYIRTSRAASGGRRIKNEALAAYFRKVVQSYKIGKPEEFYRYFAERTGKKRKRVRIAEKKPESRMSQKKEPEGEEFEH